MYRMFGEGSRRLPLFVLAAFLSITAIGWAGSVFAADVSAEDPEWLGMSLNLLGGLALFLFGMEHMASGLKAAAGEQMKVILAKLTTNRFLGATTGALVTAVIQSSSVTTVLVVGFVSAGLMTLSQSVGVIMGANIGTTITAQIVAFKVTKAALPMIAFGFGFFFFGKSEKARHYGGIVMGLGLVFYGMNVMGATMAPLRTYQPFLDLMQAMDNPLLAVLVAAVFTALVQSSSATTGIVIVMASQGFISLPAGIAMALGANVGTCFTAILAAIGKPRAAARASVVHVLFNVIGVLIWIGFIEVLADLSISVSPTAEHLSGTARLAAETPRQIANANTLFNLVNTILMIGFTVPIARFAEKIIPDKPETELKAIITPKYLDEELIETPALALDRVRLEIGRLGEIVIGMMTQVPPALAERSLEKLREIRKLDDQADQLRDDVVDYLRRIGSMNLTERQGHDFVLYMGASQDLESIGDIIETDVVDVGKKYIEKDLQVSETTNFILRELYQAVLASLQTSVRAIAEEDERAAQDVLVKADEIEHLLAQALQHQAERLVVNEPDRLALHKLETDVIAMLERIYSVTRHVARLVVAEPADKEDI